MASRISFFMNPEDERAFFRYVARFELEVYPLRIPPDWRPLPASEEALPNLPDGPLYLAAVSAGPLRVDRIKRGPDKGSWHVDELRSPVIYFERSKLTADGELLSGRLWAELDVTPRTGRREASPERFRRLFMEIETWVKKSYIRSEPKGFLIGPSAARQLKQGLTLRDSSFKGGVVRSRR